MSLSYEDSKKEDDGKRNGGCCFQFASNLQPPKIGKDDQDKNSDATEQKQWRAKQRSEQTQERRHGEGANANVLVRPLAFKPNEQPERQCDGRLDRDFHRWEGRIPATESSQPVLDLLDTPPNADHLLTTEDRS